MEDIKFQFTRDFQTSLQYIKDSQCLPECTWSGNACHQIQFYNENLTEELLEILSRTKVYYLDLEECHTSEETCCIANIKGNVLKIWLNDSPVNYTLHLRLIEPDGTIWEGECAYGFGAGYEEDEE